MPSITYDRFDGGFDLRKGASVSDANRLRNLVNAHVTSGRAIRMRPALTSVATLEAGTKGLVAADDKLHTFYESGSITHANSLFQANKVAHPTTTQLVEKVHHADEFDGYLYLSAEYADGSIWHHYLDGSSPTHIADANCPHSASWIKLSSKIWALNGDTAPFSATGLPRNWTLAEDAGYLPVGLQQAGGNNAKGLGQRDNDLVVFFSNSAQLWAHDPDPALHVFRKPIKGVGTNFHGSVEQLSDDSYFLSDFGFRSITVARNGNPTDMDVGSPIDKHVKPLINSSISPLAKYYSGGGQYWCAIGTSVFVYTYSHSNKLSAWSEYTFPAGFDAIAELNSTLYVRIGDEVYSLDDSATDDYGTDFEVRIELPFLNFKKPGVLKHIIGMDAIIEGSMDIQFRWDPNDETLITEKIPLTGDTQVNQMIPIGLTSTQIAPVITATSSDGICQLDSLTFYYDNLGVM